MTKRTWHYAHHPSMFDVHCELCGEKEDINWSEFQKHMWCYKCEKDVEITNSLLNGPIQVGIAEILGVNFDIRIIATDKILKYDSVSGKHINMEKVDNFEKIRELLEFRSKDDFYFLQILQRKKDHKTSGMKVNGANNNSRLVKAYYIHSLEYFDFIKPEVIELCELFNARAGINLNRRSYEKMALQHLRKVTDQIINEEYTKACKAYPSVVGAYNNDTDKKWIIDIDNNLWTEEDVRDLVEKELNNITPVGDKFIIALPSKNGWHAIVKLFNVSEARAGLKAYGLYDGQDDCIAKNNPTNLYIP